MMKQPVTAFLGLGSNRGIRRQLLEEATWMISARIGTIVSQSSVYESEPWGFRDETPFLNMVVEIATFLEPEEILAEIMVIEDGLGRVRDPKSGQRYSPRKMDIDILFYDQAVIETETLVIPHLHVQERRFVLVPLCEIAPYFVHPVFGQTMERLLRACTDKSPVRKV
jgi:2-amino-4-hydroxy-6-hydroxymethyldihydropteridine diphosphokinase